MNISDKIPNRLALAFLLTNKINSIKPWYRGGYYYKERSNRVLIVGNIDYTPIIHVYDDRMTIVSSLVKKSSVAKICYNQFFIDWIAPIVLSRRKLKKNGAYVGDTLCDKYGNHNMNGQYVFEYRLDYKS